ncbi:hypothetical protein F5148DRAFT_1369887 [Russula earlei]|uniref:Uncharacterized protein n=2 Tax=Russula earlei TaxID=71964 RepID=A0ACC0TZV0_9AGAM|nr:hypothetical protein F5148DRAFT_1370568 [Russula earlei]KAI9455200.1 hypothetical protein F5148DRAFT_1369887 [Russula earlei]
MNEVSETREYQRHTVNGRSPLLPGLKGSAQGVHVSLSGNLIIIEIVHQLEANVAFSTLGKNPPILSRLSPPPSNKIEIQGGLDAFRLGEDGYELLESKFIAAKRREGKREKTDENKTQQSGSVLIPFSNSTFPCHQEKKTNNKGQRTTLAFVLTKAEDQDGTHAMPATCNVDKNPQINAPGPIVAMSPVSDGASAHNTPIWNPSEERFPKPHSQYDAIA